MDLLESFSEASGQSLNVHKSNHYFSTNTDDGIKREIKGIIGMEEAGESAQYSRLPTFWGK